jgi:predicted branched-subunit amino acid permease
MFGNPSFRKGVRDGLVIVAAVVPFAVAYGVLAVDAGLSRGLTLFSSIIIVSGAAQFAMVGLLAAGPAPVLLAATGLGLRHLPMSARLADMIEAQPLLTRLRLAFILVDETFGLSVRAYDAGVEDVVAFKTAADLMLYTGWVVGTAVGAWFGSSIDPEAAGIGIMFGLLFLGLALPMVKIRRDWVVAGTAVVATLIAIKTLPVAWQVSTAALAASLVGMALDE